MNRTIFKFWNILAVCVVSIVFQVTTFAQNQSILGKFSALESGGKIYLSWLVLAGNSCNDVEIHRTTDTLHFERIATNPGVCGSLSQALSYDFTDEHPVQNATNYYRLNLGVYGYSAVVAVDVIRIDPSGYQLRPNPMQQEGLIYFDNDNQELLQVTILSVSGQVTETFTTQTDRIHVDSSSLPGGLYSFTISNMQGALKLRGMFMVQH